MGRVSVVVAVFKVTTRVRPSGRECKEITLTRGHFEAGNRSSDRSTSEPILISDDQWCHFEVDCNCCRYPDDQCFQKLCSFCWISCHRDNLERFTSSKEGSGTVVWASPIRKCPGVNAVRSSGSSERGSNGRELSTASIWERRVLSSSQVNSVSPMVRLRWSLTNLTAAFHFPPKWGLPGGLNFHSVSSLSKIESPLGAEWE